MNFVILKTEVISPDMYIDACRDGALKFYIQTFQFSQIVNGLREFKIVEQYETTQENLENDFAKTVNEKRSKV